MTEVGKYCRKLDEEIGEQWSNDYIELPKYMQLYADEQVKKVLDEVEKSLIFVNTKEECSEIDYYNRGISRQRNKIQEVINKLRNYE